MTIQIILAALCKFICWFQSGTIYILSASINQFPMKILLYEMISITPFNSFVNPMFVMFVNRKAKYHNNSIKVIKSTDYNTHYKQTMSVDKKRTF